MATSSALPYDDDDFEVSHPPTKPLKKKIQVVPLHRPRSDDDENPPLQPLPKHIPPTSLREPFTVNEAILASLWPFQYAERFKFPRGVPVDVKQKVKEDLMGRLPTILHPYAPTADDANLSRLGRSFLILSPTQHRQIFSNIANYLNHLVMSEKKEIPPTKIMEARNKYLSKLEEEKSDKSKKGQKYYQYKAKPDEIERNAPSTYYQLLPLLRPEVQKTLKDTDLPPHYKERRSHDLNLTTALLPAISDQMDVANSAFKHGFLPAQEPPDPGMDLKSKKEKLEEQARKVVNQGNLMLYQYRGPQTFWKGQQQATSEFHQDQKMTAPFRIPKYDDPMFRQILETYKFDTIPGMLLTSTNPLTQAAEDAFIEHLARSFILWNLLTLPATEDDQSNVGENIQGSRLTAEERDEGFDADFPEDGEDIDDTIYANVTPTVETFTIIQFYLKQFNNSSDIRVRCQFPPP